MNRFNKLTGVLFFVINFSLIWITIIIAEVIVSLSRLDETSGYMLTEDEEVVLFLLFSIPMLLVQLLIILLISLYLKRKLYKKSTILLNGVAHFSLYLWFVYSVYQFTINGY